MKSCYTWGINVGIIRNHYCTVNLIYLGTSVAVLAGYHIVADSLPDKELPLTCNQCHFVTALQHS